MSQTYFAILTAIGEAKLANAISLGTQLQVSRMAVGDGNGALPVPIRTQTALVRETYRADLNSLMVDPVNASQIIAELVIPDVEGGYWLREMGLYDAAGDLIALANCPPSYKPVLGEGSGRTQVMRMVLVVASTTAIQLKIDPSVVLATREYVDISVTEAIAKMDFKHSVLVATTANIVLSGIQTVDGELLPVGARVLVKDQTQAKDNGIYVVPAAGAWKRAQDADTSVEVTPGLFVSVEKGTANSDSVWQLITDAPIVLGTTALVFEMVAGRTGISAGSYAVITVDKYGRVIAGTNPTTLSGHGIDIATQAEAEAQADQDNVKPMTALRVFQAITKRVIQATETAFGWAKIATQTQTNSGVDDTTIVTPKKFSAGIAALVIQATETIRGIAKVATLAQCSAGTDDTAFVTPWKMRWGFAISLTENGHIALPAWLGGFVLQWGKATAASGSVSVNFPMAFPTACLLTPHMTASSNSPQWLSWTAGNLTRTGFSGYCTVSYSSGSYGNGSFSWWAIGY